MEIEFPQQLLLVDPIPTLYRRVIRVRLLDLDPFFLFGHCWSGGSGEGGREG